MGEARAHRRVGARDLGLTPRLDRSRVVAGAIVAAGLGVGLAAALGHQAQGRTHVGPTSATLDEAFSSFVGAGIGLAVGSGLCAFSIRHGSPLLSGLLAGLAAYVFVLAPVLIATDDVGLAEDLSGGDLGFLAFLLLPFAAFGATIGAFVASFVHRDRMQKGPFTRR